MEDLHVVRVCKSCGNQFTGIYCNLCGEKVLQPADRSFKALLSNILIAVTFADGKLVNTLWLMVRSPGFISREFAEGRRVKYLKPLSVFFVLNLIYFLFPLIQLFNASLITQLRAPYNKLVQHAVASKMVSMGVSDIQAFSLIYNQKTEGLAKMMVMVFVILASLPLNILYRKKNRYFTDHVGYQVELACFNLLINAIFLSAIVKTFGFGNYLNELALTLIFVCTNLYFLLRSGAIFYNERGWRLILKSVLMIAVLKLVLEAYRAILFFVTMGAM